MRFLHSISIAALLIGSSHLHAQTLDDFETYSVAPMSGEVIVSGSLDDTTITGTGQGPGLVEDGCTYSDIGGSLQWNGDGWVGLNTKTLMGNNTTLTLTYDNPATDIEFTLQAFDLWGEVATVDLYDEFGTLISSTPGINVPDSTPVPFVHSGTAIKTVNIIATVQPWSPILDDHKYSTGSPLNLGIGGACPGPMQLVLTGVTPLGDAAIAYGFPGSFVIPSGPCIGTTIDLAPVPTLAGTFTADAFGSISISFTAPAALCGRSVQAVDLTTCAISNVVIL